MTEPAGDKEKKLVGLVQQHVERLGRSGDTDDIGNELDTRPLSAGGTPELSPAEQLELEQAQAAVEFLNQVKADVKQIAAEDATNHPTVTLVDAARAELPENLAEPADVSRQQLGRFQLIELLGQGGFAKVFLAHDPVLQRNVALKVPKPQALMSDESRERFQREARAAALLGHPAIVPVFEAGQVGPINFIACGYCPGETLAEWFTGQDKNIDVRTAAEIIANLAEALQHAHQRGVIHRDIKPANILVEEGSGPIAGRVRITDFGLARQLESDDQTITTEGAIVGTPAYMSPEQASGSSHLSASTDIYSLGVILYELICGQRPHAGSSGLATLRVIESQPPQPPGKINPSIPRDLEAICLKCLEKQSANRYSTSWDLAVDLHDWLAGRPVVARPVTSLERLSRWCQRNPALAAALAFAFVSLVVGLSLTTWQWQKANDNLTLANLETKRAREFGNRTSGALQIFTGSFQSIHPNFSPDPNMTAREVLVNARSEFEKSELDDEGKLILLETLVDSHIGVGDYSNALKLAEERVDVAIRIYGIDHSETRLANNRLAWCLALVGQLDEAIEIQHQLVDEQALIDADHPDMEVYERDLAMLMHATGRFRDAIRLGESALLRREQRLGPGHLDNVEILQPLAQAYTDDDDPDIAVKLLDRSIDILNAHYPDDQEHPVLLMSWNGLAAAYQGQGRRKEAAKTFAKVLNLHRKRLGDTHPTTVLSMLSSAECLIRDSQHQPAIDLCNEALTISTEKLGETHPHSIRAYKLLGTAYSLAERHDDAISTFEKAVELQIQQYPENDYDYFRLNSQLAAIYQGAKNTDESIKLFEETIEFQSQHLDRLSPVLLTSEVGLADSLFMKGNRKRAVEILESVLDRLFERDEQGHPRTLAVLNSLATNYALMNRPADAIEMLEHTVVGHELEYGPANLRTLGALTNLGFSYWQAREFDQSIETLEEVIQRAEGNLPETHFVPQTAKAALGKAIRDLGRVDEGWEMLEQVYKQNRENPRFGWVRMELLPYYLAEKRGADYVGLVNDELAVIRTQVAPTDKRFGDYLVGTGSKLVSLEEFERAIEFFQEGLQVRQGIDSQAWFTFNAQSLLGDALLRQREFDEALPLLTSGQQGLKEHRDEIPETVRSKLIIDATERLLRHAEAVHYDESIERWKAELAELKSGQSDD